MTALDVRPCERGPVGACIANPVLPERCYRCDSPMRAARTRLALALADADRDVLDRIAHDLEQDRLITDALHRLAQLIHRARRRPWWRPRTPTAPAAGSTTRTTTSPSPITNDV